MISRRDFIRISGMATAAALMNWQFPGLTKRARADEGGYDAIIIGAGLGGLSCAALMARYGMRPLVIDKRDVPGGYATSFQRGANGEFTCEVSLHGITGNPLSQVLLKQLGVLDKLVLMPHTYSWNALYPDFPVSFPQPPLDVLQSIMPVIQGIFQEPETRPDVLPDLLLQLDFYLNSVFTEPNGSIYSVLAAYFPEEEGLAGYMACWRDLLADILKFYLEDEELPKVLTSKTFPYPTWASMLWKKRKGNRKTLDDLLEEYNIEDPVLRAILGQSWPYYGLPPAEIPAWFYLMNTGLYHAFGNFYLQGKTEDADGTSQDLSKALMESIIAPMTVYPDGTPHPGGDVFLGTEVTQIILDPETGRAVGVATVTAQGDYTEYYAGAVISNAAARQTFTKLLPESAVPKKYLKTLSSYEPSHSHFNVWLGVDLTRASDEFLATYNELGSNTALYPSYQHDQMYRALAQGDPEGSPVAVIAYDKLPNRPPNGNASITITIPCGYRSWKKFEAVYKNAYFNIGEETNEDVTIDDYYAEKNRIVNTLIRLVDKKLLSGLIDRDTGELASFIEMTEASTPLTNARFTYNTQGAIYGYEQSLDNSGLSRLGNRTPISGLYLAGAWTNPGGSFELVMLSGKEAVKCIVEDWGLA